MERIRPKTLSLRALRQLPTEVDEDGVSLPTNHWRPQTRGDCIHGPRPCPYVGCRFNLYLDVDKSTGSVKFNFPDVPADELERLPASCALDIADDRMHSLREIAAFMNFMSRERSRQVLKQLHERLTDLCEAAGIDCRLIWDKNTGE